MWNKQEKRYKSGPKVPHVLPHSKTKAALNGCARAICYISVLRNSYLSCVQVQTRCLF